MGRPIEYEGARPIKVDAFMGESVSRRDNSVCITFYRAGQKLCKDALRSPRENSRIEHAVALTTLALFFGCGMLTEDVLIFI